ncbi:hypothetical protein [Nocardia sp. CA-119907]|uniref:hypothetical protein n=1 Tax=Nocardia sp. CA-119907 TaxID=3239973 RepID=UPI003D99218C
MTAGLIAVFARSRRRETKRGPDSRGSTARFSYMPESIVAGAGMSESTAQRSSRTPDSSVGEVAA